MKKYETPPRLYSTPGIGDVRRMLAPELGVYRLRDEKALLKLAMKRCGGQANPTHMLDIVRELLRETA